MFFLDLILYKLACLIWPDKPKQYTDSSQRSNGEDSANWIILEDHRDHHIPDFDDKSDNDPYLNGEHDDGPDW